MNKVLMSSLFSGFLLTGISFAQTPPPAAPPAAPAAVVAVPVHHHDRFPEINKAMRKLRGAKADLDKAAHDYGGHKEKAIAAINEALEELRAAKEFVAAK